MFLEEHDIRLKGTRVGIETILTEYIDNCRTPEVIAFHYYTPTLGTDLRHNPILSTK